MRKQLLFTTDYTAYTDQVDNINWNAVARDLECDGYRETNGYIFTI